MLENLKNVRKEKKLSQKDIADVLGVVRSVYAKYETFERIIPLKHINTLSNYFNVSMDYLAGLSSNKNRFNFKKIDKLDGNIIQDNILFIRKKYNLTQKALGDKISVSDVAVSKLERGKIILTTSVALEICKQFNISLDWLVGKSKNMFITKEII